MGMWESKSERSRSRQDSKAGLWNGTQLTRTVGIDGHRLAICGLKRRCEQPKYQFPDGRYFRNGDPKFRIWPKEWGEYVLPPAEPQLKPLWVRPRLPGEG